MYDPTVGKFLSEDPIGFSAGDPNLSRMVGNNVLNATDPYGLEIKPGGKPPTMSQEDFNNTYKVFKEALEQMKMMDGLAKAIAHELTQKVADKGDIYLIQVSAKTLPHATTVTLATEKKTITVYPGDDLFPGDAGAFPDGGMIERPLDRAIILICHEFGHAYFAFKDPANVALIENMIRAELRLPLRDDYDGAMIEGETERQKKLVEGFKARWEKEFKKMEEEMKGAEK